MRVVVVGAGPAGCSAAYWLARGGADVRLVEKEAMPRRKLCSGVLTAWSERRAQEICPDLLRRAPGLGRAQESRLVTGGGAVDVRHRPTTWVDRAAFDHLLALAAAAAGAQVRDGERVGAEEIDGWLAEGVLVVAADGANSRMARRLQPAGVRFLGVEAVVAYPRGPGRAMLDFTLPGGYRWIFPRADGTAGIGGATVRREDWGSLPDRVREFAAQQGAAIRGRIDGHLMRFVPFGPVARRGLFLVGEAAGALDAVLGEGIRFALESGRLAALAILQGAGAERRYQETYRREIGRLLTLRGRLFRLGEAVPQAFLAALRTPFVRDAVAAHFLGRRDA